VSALDEDDCNKSPHSRMKKSGMDIRGLGLAYCRTLWTGAGFLLLNCSRKFFLGVTASFCEFPVITEKNNLR